MVVSHKKFYHLLPVLMLVVVLVIGYSGDQKALSLSKPLSFYSTSMGSWTFSFDEVSCVFLMMVSCVSLSVFAYSLGYMFGDEMWNKFIQILSLFALSMVFLSVSSSPVTSMIGWDGLGLSSVALIFYYSGWVSFRNGMVTFFCNRLGDVFFLTLIVLFSVTPCSLTIEHAMALMISAVTKSAQIPFHIWLPMAMAAPTPVSSLVHSSTLVTAGVYILVRYKLDFSEVQMILFCLSSITLFFSGVSSMFEMDLKKVIALSTLIHVSLIMIFVSLGDFLPALAHLLCHAFMKSGLFMVGGWTIHSMQGSQDIRNLSVHTSSSPSASVFLIMSLLSMIGFPFLSGFFSKELMLGTLVESSEVNVSLLMVYFGLVFSVAYSSRILFYLFTNPTPSFSSSSWSNSKAMFFPLALSVVGSLLLGSVIALFIPEVENMQEGVYVLPMEKLLVLTLTVIAMSLVFLSLGAPLGGMISSSWSKMGLLPAIFSYLRMAVPLVGGVSHSMDKEGLLGLSMKSMSNFVREFTVVITPYLEGGKIQLLKLGLLFVMVYTLSHT